MTAFYQATPFQTLEEIDGAIGEAIAIAGPAIDFCDAPLTANVLDAPALREAVQHTLL